MVGEEGQSPSLSLNSNHLVETMSVPMQQPMQQQDMSRIFKSEQESLKLSSFESDLQGVEDRLLSKYQGRE